MLTQRITPDGLAYRDLNGNSRLDPYEDPRLDVDERVSDLIGRLSLPEKIGLMFHTVIEAGADGSVLAGPGAISKSGTVEVVTSKLLNHFNVHHLGEPRAAARWYNAVQALAETTPHGIPVTISSDPRHSFAENAGASFSAGSFSQWPEMLGLAALRDPGLVRRFADTARREYLAVGIRAALHPTLDLATDARWARQAQTFGQDPALVAELGTAYIEGMQGPCLGRDSVACTAKHFPGGGAVKDGEDSHFPYGAEAVYPSGSQEAHLSPFPAAIAAGVSAVMPYYSKPIGLTLRGIEADEVGFGYNRAIITDLLRGELGFGGVVLSDWELVNDNHVGDQVLPARAWGVEDLDPAGRMQLLLEAGCDQLGGEECVEILAGLVADGRVSEARIDESVGRLLRVKFELGLFDDPYVDEEKAAEVLGERASHAEGLRAQSASVTVLKGSLPVTAGRVYVEGLDRAAASRLGEVVDRPEDADVAVIRLQAPFEPRDDLFLESWFHQGSLDFPPGLAWRLARIARHCRLVLDVFLDRPAVVTGLLEVADVLVADYGTSDEALVDALTGEVEAVGRLPFDLPRSMDDVRAHPEDRVGIEDPLFPAGFRAS